MQLGGRKNGSKEIQTDEKRVCQSLFSNVITISVTIYSDVVML